MHQAGIQMDAATIERIAKLRRDFGDDDAAIAKATRELLENHRKGE